MQMDEFDIGRITLIEREKGKVIGLCHGCFDILHFGHIEHFKLAKNYCDTLFVSVTSDQFVNKGPGRPYNRLEHRLLVLNAIENIDYAFGSNQSDATWSLSRVRPDYYFKGSDYNRDKNYNRNFDLEKSFADSLGTKTIFTNGDTGSSTALFNKLQTNTNVEPQLTG